MRAVAEWVGFGVMGLGAALAALGVWWLLIEAIWCLAKRTSGSTRLAWMAFHEARRIRAEKVVREMKERKP